MATASFGGLSQGRWGDNTASVGVTFRDFLITDLKGVPQQTMILRKKGMLLIAFVTAHDDSSRTLLPLLQSLSDAYKESGKLAVLAVSETDHDAETKAFAEASGAMFPVVIDRERYHAMNYGFTVYPTVLLVNAAGQVLHKAKGDKALAALQPIADAIGTFAGAEQPARLTGSAFAPAVMPPPPPPADPPAAKP